MSNLAVIVPTKFECVRTGAVTLGFRIYDDYGAEYCNLLESIPDDDIELLEEVVKLVGDVGQGILDSVVENELGISIGDAHYEWDEIKDILDTEEGWACYEDWRRHGASD